MDGARAPLCCGMTQDKTFYSFDAQSGRPAVVILAGALGQPRIAPLAAAFQHRSGDFALIGADVLLLVDGQGQHGFGYESWRPETPQIIYCMGEFFARCGFDHGRPWIFVMDRNQRLVRSIDAETDPDPARTAYECLAALPVEEPREVVLPAPVLMVPHVLDPSFCRRLIDHFEGSAHAQGGMAGVDGAGRPILKLDVDKKHRRDCVVSPVEPICGEIIEALSHSCLPEMKKAFQFDASFTDRILLARYDDTGGYFRRHRDNVAAAVAFRQFAISVNLNTEEYEGGYLTFPEYNGHRYRPGRGSGIIFSASLLHEATPVTRGSRYVLLTFFHNAEAQARRTANAPDAAVAA